MGLQFVQDSSKGISDFSSNPRVPPWSSGSIGSAPQCLRDGQTSPDRMWVKPHSPSF